MSEQRVVSVASGGGTPSVMIAGGSVSISGLALNISGSSVNVSGNVVNISGQSVLLYSGSNLVQIASGYNQVQLLSGVNQVQLISGFNQVYIGGSGIFSISGCGSAASGGVVLASCGPIVSATLRNLSGNGPMMIGGISTGSYPAAGIGMELFQTETITLRVTNTNQISVFNEQTATSGQNIFVIATCSYY